MCFTIDTLNIKYILLTRKVRRSEKYMLIILKQRSKIIFINFALHLSTFIFWLWTLCIPFQFGHGFFLFLGTSAPGFFVVAFPSNFDDSFSVLCLAGFLTFVTTSLAFS